MTRRPGVALKALHAARFGAPLWPIHEAAHAALRGFASGPRPERDVPHTLRILSRALWFAGDYLGAAAVRVILSALFDRTGTFAGAAARIVPLYVESGRPHEAVNLLDAIVGRADLPDREARPLIFGAYLVARGHPDAQTEARTPLGATFRRYAAARGLPAPTGVPWPADVLALDAADEHRLNPLADWDRTLDGLTTRAAVRRALRALLLTLPHAWDQREARRKARVREAEIRGEPRPEPEVGPARFFRPVPPKKRPAPPREEPVAWSAQFLAALPGQPPEPHLLTVGPPTLRDGTWTCRVRATRFADPFEIAGETPAAALRFAITFAQRLYDGHARADHDGNPLVWPGRPEGGPP